MRELIQNTALSSSDKAIFIAGAAIVIVLILVILYKIDQMPPEYQKRKKTKVKKEKNVPVYGIYERGGLLIDEEKKITCFGEVDFFE